MRINKYLASKKYCTRREADEVIKKGKVFINGRVAILGDKITEKDSVEVKWRAKNCRYYAYNKPRGIITHCPLISKMYSLSAGWTKIRSD